jgi:hypothetical protein
VFIPAFRATFLPALAFLLILLPSFGAPAAAQTAPEAQGKAAGPRAGSDLDAFMEKVLARREINRAMLNQYVLDEAETFEILGPGRWPLHRTKREFTWYERDGMHVRSPLRVGGVAVGEAERRAYENSWIHREQERQARKARNEKEKGEISIGGGGVQVSGTAVPTEPSFVSEAYFMDFKFEPGNYYLAGREKLEGHDVLRIEYYPTHLFNDDDDEKTPKELKGKPAKPNDKGARREQQREQDIDRKMNKTALVTLWVDPAEHQIVKYDFQNVWLDFLPGSWLVRVDDLRAAMTMGQPFPGVWLPRGMNIHAGLTLASGSFEASYGRSFSDYREADVKTRITVPKGGELPEPGPMDERNERPEGHGPFVPEQPPQPAEIIREIRVHGNASLADEAVLTLAGISVGDPVPGDGVQTIERRLKDSDRFETVEVRKRYRSLDDPTDVAIVLVVHERPGVTSATPDGVPSLSRPWRRVTSRLMFLPILSYADGYGFTYGGRISTVDLLGAGERLSVPLTWGGTRRAALEFERTFKGGPLTRISSAFGIRQRDNPHFDIADRRVELEARAERQFAQVVRLGIETSRSSVEFGTLHDRLWTLGANAVLDTRADPAFPRNAVVLGAGWSELNVKGWSKINRYQADARGYVGIIRQAVAAGRVQYFTTDATLPPYERLLLGGAPTLRGFRAGAFDGDRMLVTSAELRTPITSVISGAKLGITVFADAAKAVGFGSPLEGGVWHRGAGAGLFLIAPLVQINLDVAHGLDGGGTRLNIGSGFSF